MRRDFRDEGFFDTSFTRDTFLFKGLLSGVDTGWQLTLTSNRRTACRKLRIPFRHVFYVGKGSKQISYFSRTRIVNSTGQTS